jgi:hypothetical protein
MQSPTFGQLLGSTVVLVGLVVVAEAYSPKLAMGLAVTLLIAIALANPEVTRQIATIAQEVASGKVKSS